jgi:hypothetical protein
MGPTLGLDVFPSLHGWRKPMRRLALLALAVLLVVGFLWAAPFHRTPARSEASSPAGTAAPAVASARMPASTASPATPQGTQTAVGVQTAPIDPPQADLAAIASSPPAATASGPSAIVPSLASTAVGDPETGGSSPRGASPRINLAPSGHCSVSLNRALLARDVNRSERSPLGVADAFPASGDPVYLFMEVSNPAGPARDLRVRWEHPGSHHVFEEHIPAGVSPRWRTWVYHLIQPGLTGAWRVRVFDARGCQVGELGFDAR